MKSSIPKPTVMASVILLSSLSHTNQICADGCPAPSFAARRAFEAGDIPQSVAVGDFNGDGKPDLAVANGSSPGGSVSLLLGRGDGTFQTAVSYAAGAAPHSVAVGDFNGDGRVDLAVANAGGGNVSVLLGRGDGTFQPAANYDVGASPYSVAVGDFNGDGMADLAVANTGAGTISVLLGRGDGTFRTAVNYGVGASPRSVAVGDFNGDGKVDLAVANAGGGNVSVLLGNGDGTLDLVVCSQGIWPNYTNGAVWVLLGKGDGAFHAAVNYGVGDRADPTSVAIA